MKQVFHIFYHNIDCIVIDAVICGNKLPALYDPINVTYGMYDVLVLFISCNLHAYPVFEEDNGVIIS